MPPFLATSTGYITPSYPGQKRAGNAGDLANVTAAAVATAAHVAATGTLTTQTPAAQGVSDNRIDPFFTLPKTYQLSQSVKIVGNAEPLVDSNRVYLALQRIHEWLSGGELADTAQADQPDPKKIKTAVEKFSAKLKTSPANPLIRDLCYQCLTAVNS